MLALLLLAAVASSVLMFRLLAFSETNAQAGSAPERWPAETSLQRAGGSHPDLLVFIHPYCECTEATLDELSTLIPSNSAVTFLIYRPHDSGWKANSLVQRLSAMGSARVVWDEDGREAKRFGARTSGYTMLYGASGELLFRGGVTGSRGHRGDNYGLDDLQAALRSGVPARKAHAVFGCALGGNTGQKKL